jgi:hypothetical protein
MKSHIKTIIIICTLLITSTAFSLIRIKPLSNFNDNDPKLFKFIIGKWTLSSGRCLSGAPVNWGGDLSKFKMQFEFKQDLTFDTQVFLNNILTVTSSGSYSIQHAVLSIYEITDCEHVQNIQCSPGTDSHVMMSVQNEHLVLLSNQGDNGGSCPAEDIFVTQFDRLD